MVALSDVQILPFSNFFLITDPTVKTYFLSIFLKQTCFFGRTQICCPREDGWDSGAGAVNNPDLHGMSQRRILMRTDFAVRMPMMPASLSSSGLKRVVAPFSH